MKYLSIKDKKKRVAFRKLELKKLLGKSLLCDLNLSYNLRGGLFSIIKKYQIFSKVNIRNRCVISNRPRYVFTKYRVSRLTFKRLVVLGRISGVYKYIW